MVFLNLTFSSLAIANDQSLSPKGFRLNENLIEKDFTMMSKIPSEKDLVTFITKSNYKIETPMAEEIAINILKTSKCFKIDPWILTALIKKESSFNPQAVSPTNAVGLTQFTSAGINEVNDQLGLNKTSHAAAESIEYFNQQIRSCIDPTWKHVWHRVAVKKDDVNFINEIKSILIEDIELAVTYGAILLKTYLIVVDSKNDLKTSETYFKALQIYNGEPGEAKVEYARNVFRHLQELYPKKIAFNF